MAYLADAVVQGGLAAAQTVAAGGAFAQSRSQHAEAMERTHQLHQDAIEKAQRQFARSFVQVGSVSSRCRV
jgi:hypothetical protein